MAAPCPPAVTYAEAVAVLRDPATKGIHKYLYLRNCQYFFPELFYQILLGCVEEVLPYIYTPTVGEACMYYSNLPLVPIGLRLSLADKGNILARLRAWPNQAIKLVVLTDGERILGLGDLGTNGLGISEGKILLYVAAGGVDPSHCLPLNIDMGTNTERLLLDPEYKGLRTRRPPIAEFDEMLEEIVSALEAWRPHLLLQFEDFGNTNAFRLLDNYRERICSFNDDIQGTACVTLAAILAALRVTNASLADQRVLFFGAGEAGTGIGELISKALAKHHGLTIEAARERCFFMDSHGLVCKSRTDLQHHKVPFAHDVPFCPDLLSAVEALKPTALIGVSTIPSAFSGPVLRAMAALHPRPLIFPLSNPTSKAECTFQEAVEATDGRVLFASGSPFPPLTWKGVLLHPAQANNAYVFPAIGFSAVQCACSIITDDVFLAAAYKLSELQKEEDIERGYLFPPFSAIQAVSAKLGAGVLQYMFDHGYAREPLPGSGPAADWEALYREQMWQCAPGASAGPPL